MSSRAPAPALARSTSAPAPRTSSINIVQYLCAREIALAPPYIRSASRARLKRKAVAAELDDPTEEEEDTLPVPAVPRCSLLPCGSYPASFFSRALPIERLHLLFARPPPSLRFRLSDLFDLDRYPQLREHVFLSFDRTGLLLLSYLKSADGAYSLHCWRFHPHRPLRLAASFPLFRTLSDGGNSSDSSHSLGDEASVRRQLGLGDSGDEDHLYIQLIEATDSSCFAVVGVGQDPTATLPLNQSVKVHVSILPSPAAMRTTFPTHQTHFSFVSSLRIPQVDLLTLQDEYSSQPHTHCLTFVGIDTVQCATFTISAAPALQQPLASTAASSPSSSGPPSQRPLESESESDVHPLRRTSSLLSSALTRTDWLSDLVSLDCFGSPLPSSLPAASPPLVSPWTLEIEVFVRAACTGSGRQMLDYGFNVVRVDGFRTSSTRSRTILLVLETGADSTRSSPSSNQFEASLLVWNMERLGEVERVPLPWSNSALRRLLGVHKLACASSQCSDAERISQAGAHELLKSIARPMPLQYRRLAVTNAPLFTHKSRQLLLNTTFPFAVGL